VGKHIPTELDNCWAEGLAVSRDGGIANQSPFADFTLEAWSDLLNGAEDPHRRPDQLGTDPFSGQDSDQSPTGLLLFHW
jgi:hypothetical protein